MVLLEDAWRQLDQLFTLGPTLAATTTSLPTSGSRTNKRMSD